MAILDESFEGIATVKANAEKNLQNARALFDSQLSTLVAGLDIMELIPLSKLATDITDCDHVPPQSQQLVYPVITIG